MPAIGFLQGNLMCNERFARQNLPARMERSSITHAISHIYVATLL
jgi:hypothetical protein